LDSGLILRIKQLTITALRRTTATTQIWQQTTPNGEVHVTKPLRTQHATPEKATKDPGKHSKQLTLGLSFRHTQNQTGIVPLPTLPQQIHTLMPFQHTALPHRSATSRKTRMLCHYFPLTFPTSKGKCAFLQEKSLNILG
jgi:hypothetical protein